MLNNILSLTCDMLDAACQHEDATLRDGAYAGPLWDRKLPGSRDIVPFIRDFARLGSSVKVDLNDRHFATLRLNGDAEFDNNVLSVPYMRQFVGGDTQRDVQQISASVHPKAPGLLSGQWTQFGVAMVRLRQILPKVTWERDEAVFSWMDPPGVQVKKLGPLGLREWTVQGFIRAIRIGEFQGRIEFSSKIVTLLAPDLEWA